MADHRLLLDTHAFLWSLSSSERLSKKAQKAILESKNEVFVSKISYWEICLKISIGKLTLANGWQELIDLIGWKLIKNIVKEYSYYPGTTKTLSIAC